jgi:hypothetical protein
MEKSMRNQVKDKTELHKRLAAILPEYPLISTFNGRSGHYKAVDADGRVFLVSWACDEDKAPKRTERLLMDYTRLVKESDSQGAGWFRPEEGWSYEESDY